MIKSRMVRAICLCAGTLVCSLATADILKLPNGSLGVTQSTSAPQRGASETDVLVKFGEPVHRHRPVGTPAISSWEYAQFEVYFESGVVIHSVQRAK